MRHALVQCNSMVPRQIPLEQFPAMLGRSPDATIHLEDGWVSRKHCLIDRRGETLMVRDLGSKHGTFVNGERRAASPLHPGDKLRIGLHTYVVSDPDANSVAVEADATKFRKE